MNKVTILACLQCEPYITKLFFIRTGQHHEGYGYYLWWPGSGYFALKANIRANTITRSKVPTLIFAFPHFFGDVA